MSRHDDRVRLQHMLDHAREACGMATGRNRADLDGDRQFSLALTRLMEIIGEAAARVPPEISMALPDVPWPQIVALRNRLIHGYDEVDHDILWSIVSQNLPPLIFQLQEFLGGDGKPGSELGTAGS